MTKAELVDKVTTAASKAASTRQNPVQYSKKDVEIILTSLFDTIKAEAKKGEKVSWPQFGAFAVTQRAARVGRNPQTGETVKIKASKAMKFSPSINLKAELNRGRR